MPSLRTVRDDSEAVEAVMPIIGKGLSVKDAAAYMSLVLGITILGAQFRSCATSEYIIQQHGEALKGLSQIPALVNALERRVDSNTNKLTDHENDIADNSKAINAANERLGRFDERMIGLRKSSDDLSIAVRELTSELQAIRTFKAEGKP